MVLLCLWDICWIWAQYTSVWVSVLLLAIYRISLANLLQKEDLFEGYWETVHRFWRKCCTAKFGEGQYLGSPKGLGSRSSGVSVARWLCSNQHLSLSSFHVVRRENLAHLGSRGSLNTGSNKWGTGTGSLAVAMAPGGIVVNQAAIPIYVFSFYQHWTWKARRFME